MVVNILALCCYVCLRKILSNNHNYNKLYNKENKVIDDDEYSMDSSDHDMTDDENQSDYK